MPPRLPPRLLVAPDSFTGTLRAPQVAAAVGRGVERAGMEPPDLCPVADGGEGTLEALLLALGGETAGAEVRDPLGRPVQAGFALIEDGGTAIVEVAEASGAGRVAGGERGAGTPSTYGTGELIAAAIATGAVVVLVAAGGSVTADGGAGAIEALREHGGLRGAKLVVLCDARGAAMDGAAGGLAGGLRTAFGARLEPGAPFVLDVLETDARMRATAAVIVGEGRLDATTLTGKVPGELAVRARQAGVPCHAVCGRNDLSLFDQRILDLQRIVEAGTLEALEEAGELIAGNL